MQRSTSRCYMYMQQNTTVKVFLNLSSTDSHGLTRVTFVLSANY